MLKLAKEVEGNGDASSDVYLAVKCFFALLLSTATKVFALSSTGEGLISGGADGYVKVRPFSGLPKWLHMHKLTCCDRSGPLMREHHSCCDKISALPPTCPFPYRYGGITCKLATS